MSEKNLTSSSGRTSGPGKRLVGIGTLALVAGVLAGAVGLYVMEPGSGNETASAASSTCPADDAMKQAIDDNARGEVAAVQAADLPFNVSAIAFEDREGKRLTLADFSGKTLLVNLWATWCVPCRAEMPALDALQSQKGGADFAVIAINVDLGSIDKPQAFYADTGLKSLGLFRDDTMAVFNDLKAQGVTIGLPVSLLVDGKGCARAVLTGPAEWSSPDAIRLVEAVKGA